MGSSYTSAPWQTAAVNVRAIIVFILPGTHHSVVVDSVDLGIQRLCVMIFCAMEIKIHFDGGPNHTRWSQLTIRCGWQVLDLVLSDVCIPSEDHRVLRPDPGWVPGCNQQVLVNLPLWSFYTSLKLLLVVFGMLPTMFIFQVRMVCSTSLHPHWRQ